MEVIIEVLIECFVEILTDGGVEVMSGSEYTRRWPKGVKIAMVVFTVLFFGAMIIGFIVMGILFLVGDEPVPGVIMLLVGIGILLMIIFTIRRERRKRNNTV